jgi:succinate dehydrogenase/fumarate reductase flavoprotein subunit
MEFPLWSSSLFGMMVPGVSTRSQLGARWVNALGERVMEKHYPDRKENVARHLVARAIIEEYESGNGPVFLDVRHLPDKNRNMVFERWLPRTVQGYFQSRNIDFKKEPVEMVAHGDQALPGSIGAGIMVNRDMATTFENVYAIGDCANGGGGIFGGGLSWAGVGGMVAAEHFARRCKTISLNKANSRDVEQAICFVNEPLQRKNATINEEAVEHNLRRIMSTYVGYMRNEAGLSMALQRVTALKEVLPDIKVEDPHQLMKFFEVRSMLDCAEGIVRSALLRKESRLVPCHYRVDYPARDDANWYGKRVTVRMENGVQKLDIVAYA